MRTSGAVRIVNVGRSTDYFLRICAYKKDTLRPSTKCKRRRVNRTHSHTHTFAHARTKMRKEENTHTHTHIPEHGDTVARAKNTNVVHVGTLGGRTAL